jgi:hypothetical protein
MPAITQTHLKYCTNYQQAEQALESAIYIATFIKSISLLASPDKRLDLSDEQKEGFCTGLKIVIDKLHSVLEFVEDDKFHLIDLDILSGLWHPVYIFNFISFYSSSNSFNELSDDELTGLSFLIDEAIGLIHKAVVCLKQKAGCQ